MASYAGYYSGNILGLLVEEVLLAYFTLGVGTLSKTSSRAVSKAEKAISTLVKAQPSTLPKPNTTLGSLVTKTSLLKEII